MIKRFAQLIAANCALFLCSFTAIACTVNMSGPMPLCSISSAAWNERTVIITGSRNGPTNLRFGKRGQTALLTDVRIEFGSGPLYLVLSNYGAAIYRFTGAVSEISRITALGSSTYGPDHFGIIGVPKSKILRVAVKGRDTSRITDCAAPPKACIPDQFFAYSGGFIDNQRRYRSSWGQRSWPGYWWRSTPQAVIRVLPHGKAPIIISRDMPWSLKPAKRKHTRSDSSKHQAWKKRWDKLNDLQKYRDNAASVVELQLKDVYSPLGLSVDGLPPSWEGMAVLESRGLIHKSDSPRVRDLVMQWREEFSARRRNRLDPDFSFKPVVDFVVTGKIRMPRDLRAMYARNGITMLLAPGVPIPKADTKYGLGAACLYFADHRGERREYRATSCNYQKRPTDLKTTRLFYSEEHLT